MPAHALLLSACGLLVADPAADALARQHLEQLQGGWQMVRAQRDGVEPSAAELARLKLLFQGNRMIGQEGTKQSEGGAFTLDPAQTPAALDLTLPSPQGTPRLFRVIYALEGDRLVMCWGREGKERPREFASPKGSGTILFVLQREKK